MSFISVPDEDAPKPETPHLKIRDETYVGNTVDSRLSNTNTISTYIQGSRMIVDYYSQVLLRDDSASSHSDDVLHIHKQYRVIRGVPVIVSSDLSQKQNSDGGRSFEITGSGSIPFGISPNSGDVMVLDIGDGKELELTVNNTERMSIYPEAYNDIEYRGVRILERDDKAHLDSRVIETLYFNVDLQRAGLRPLLTQQDTEYRNTLRRLYGILVERYLRDFFHKDFKTILVPGQESVVYDPYITRFLKATVDHSSFPKMNDLNILSTNGDVYTNEDTIWDLLIDRDLTLLSIIPSKVGLASIAKFRNRPLRNSIYFSGVKDVVTIIDPSYSHDTMGGSAKSHKELNHGGLQVESFDKLAPIQNLNLTEPMLFYTEKKLPIVRRMGEDNYYVFTKQFYENKVPGSLLERLVLDRIDKSTTDFGNLATLAEMSLRLDNLERFYFTPIILSLIKLSDGVL